MCFLIDSNLPTYPFSKSAPSVRISIQLHYPHFHHVYANSLGGSNENCITTFEQSNHHTHYALYA